MSSLNKVILMGRLGGDPEVKTVSGNSVCTVSLATSYKYTNKSGEKVEETEWHRVVVWGNSASYLGRYAKKGTQLLVEGSLKTRSFEEGGKTRYITEIRAANVSIVTGFVEQSSSSALNDLEEASQSRAKNSFEKKSKQTKKQEPIEPDDEPSFGDDDEIPF